MTPFRSPPFTALENIRLFDWGIGDGPLGHGEDMVAAIGNFDGVHRGHRELIQQVAGMDGITPAVVTFSPHPKRYFNPDADGFLLADARDKLALLADAGAEAVIQLRFDDALRATSAGDFIHRVLPALGLSGICAGEDFAFGNDRRGNLELVAGEAERSGVAAISAPILEDGGGPVSSSRIRAALETGRLDEAARLLGRPFTISGNVIKGDQRGRDIGFPTANIGMGEMLQPAFGVYAVAVRLADREGAPVHAGIANLGRRPTVNDRGVLLEANVFDYDGDLYGQRLNVMLLDYIRPEQTFDGLDALKRQIGRDADAARAFHAENTGLTAS